MSIVKEFNEYRTRMNEKILAADNLNIKRLYNLDTNTYKDGVLSVKTKEMLGLISSMVLPCVPMDRDVSVIIWVSVTKKN